MIESLYKKTIFTSLVSILLLIQIGCTTHPLNQHVKNNALLEKKNLQLASQYLSINQPLKAITRLQKVLNLNPKSSEAYGLLGIVYQYQKEYGLSEKSFKKALQLAPTNSNIRNNYGALLYAKQQYIEAAKQFHHVTKDVYYGNRDRVFENLGATYLKMGNIQESINYYQRALRLNAFLSSASLKLAEIFFEQKKMGKAFAFYTDFAKNGHQSAESLWLGIRLAYEINKAEQALIYGKQLKALYTQSPEYKRYQTLLNDERNDQKHQK